MQIIWHGQTCFTVKDKKRTVVIDPRSDVKDLKADFVLVSHGDDQAVKVEGSNRTFSWPGEYEIKGVPLIGLEANMETEEPTTIYYAEMEGIVVCHLGKLGHKLTSEMVKKLESVDVLLIEVGEGANLDLKHTMDAIESIDPRVVVPMGSGDFSSFFREAGAEAHESQAKLDIGSRSDLPEDSRKYVELTISV